MWGVRAEMGVATMIVFMAFLIVAAIAAFVIIISQGEQETESLNTATMARREVTTQVELFDLSATDGRDGAVDDFKYKVKLKPGAEPIHLKDTVLYVSSDNDTLRLSYKEGDCRRDVTNGYYTYR